MVSALPLAAGRTSRRPPSVVRIPRQGVALHATPLAADPEVLGLNLMRGCAHLCAFCSVRGAPHYDGDDRLVLYADNLERLTAELATRSRRPRAIFISPGTDPFPPLAEFQDETAKVVAMLAGHGVEAWLMTRGQIRPAAMAGLLAHRLRVKVTIPLTTCDRDLQRQLEPLTASPRLRLKQIAKLHRLGVSVQVALDPLIPGVTDTPDNLKAVLLAVAATGVRHISASYLFLRDGIAHNLTTALAPRGLHDAVLGSYADGPVLTAPGLAAARFLPRSRRQRGYALLMSLAAVHGIRVSICGLSNPDFGAPRPTEPRPTRLPLFASDPPL